MLAISLQKTGVVALEVISYVNQHSDYSVVPGIPCLKFQFVIACIMFLYTASDQNWRCGERTLSH